MNSCPMRRPVSLGSIDLYGQRSLPQMAARVTVTRTSVASVKRASGTVSTRTSPAPYMTVARIGLPLVLVDRHQPGLGAVPGDLHGTLLAFAPRLRPLTCHRNVCEGNGPNPPIPAGRSTGAIPGEAARTQETHTPCGCSFARGSGVSILDL